MDFTYKVKMRHQWRPGVGGFGDLNWGWYCQDALLGWYCKKHNMSDIFDVILFISVTFITLHPINVL